MRSCHLAPILQKKKVVKEAWTMVEAASFVLWIESD